MIRTQIQLTEDQAEGVKRIARERGISVAAVIREAVELELAGRSDRAERWQRALAVVGKYRSGLADVAEHHDRYLAEAYLD
jgi:hypothetical protein